MKLKKFLKVGNKFRIIEEYVVLEGYEPPREKAAKANKGSADKKFENTDLMKLAKELYMCGVASFEALQAIAEFNRKTMNDLRKAYGLCSVVDGGDASWSKIDKPCKEEKANNENIRSGRYPWGADVLRVVCVETSGNSAFVVGKVYERINGFLTDDRGYEWFVLCEGDDPDEWTFRQAKFKLVD